MIARAGHPWRVGAALLLACGLLLAPLGYPGYFQPHSGFLPVYALYAWEAADHPVTGPAPFSPTGALGGDGLLPHALAALFRLAGAGGVTAVKAVFALAILLAAGGFYRLVHRSRPASTAMAALAFGVVWAASPMVLGSVYARGSLGGALALGLLPWVAEALTVAAQTSGVLAATATLWPVLALGLAHPGFALASAVVLVLVALLQRERVQPSPALALIAAGAGGLLLSGPSAPASFVQFSRPYQWLSQSAGYAIHSDPWGPGVPAPLTLGLLPLALFAAAWLLAPAARKPGRVVVTLAAALGLLLLSTTLARPLWQSVAATWLDGPWQLVALASFLLLRQAASAADRLRGRGAPAAALLLLALIVATPFLDVPVTAVTPAARPLATFADGRILLVGADLHGPLRHGATPRLHLYWQATAPLQRDYTVFVHVVDDAGTKWGQRDSWPVDGQRATSGWRPGELVADEHPVYIDVAGPREGYRLVIGLYDLETGERLPLGDGSTALEFRP